LLEHVSAGNLEILLLVEASLESDIRSELISKKKNKRKEEACGLVVKKLGREGAY